MQLQTLQPAAASVGGVGQDIRSQSAGYRVLILDFDLYKTVGGGQSAYRRIIEQCPDNKYFYFIRDEPQTAVRPPHVCVIPFEASYYGNTGALPAEMHHFYGSYLDAWQMAASVRQNLGECEFDIIDSPDYHTGALFIRTALAAHNIRAGRVALALHGAISSAFRDEWPHSWAPERLLAEIRLREHLQYRSVDTRYALSADYADLWLRYTNIRARMIDPLWIAGSFAPVLCPPGPGPADVYFIGRRERRKGPDLFADICWCLDTATYKQLVLVGADSSGHSGVSSANVLPSLIARRRLSVHSIENLSRADLDRCFSNRSLLVLPSRYDQFNLIALEALRLGCPAFVSRHAGIARWIVENYPELSDLIIDIDCSRAAAGKVRAALSDYDSFRNRLVGTISARPLAPQAGELRWMYEPNGPVDRAALQTVADIAHRFDSFNHPRPWSDLGLGYSIKIATIRNLPRPLTEILAHGRRSLKRVLRRVRAFKPKRPRLSTILPATGRALVRQGYLHPSALTQIRSMANIEGTRSRLLTQGERTSTEIAAKLRVISNELGSLRIGRVPIFRDMARLERKRGGDLVAATYCLRIMRWTGRDKFGDLDFVIDTFRKHNFGVEAEVASAMYADPATADEACARLLREQYKRHLTKPDLPLAIMDDRRTDKAPRVSVVSSLYNAESKLKTLLENMRIQSLCGKGELEIVLVDSGSPTREYEVFKAYAAQHPELPILYVRSAERETIQLAWNRGIKLARAPYLCFLGVDEGLHPDALAILTRTLDEHDEVDWVMADSIVTEVDSHGVFTKDVMTYDRAGYDQSLAYLETCYLSWVGGLYRRSIHDRFGYYDETFRAAGDTEFKFRVLTHIKTLHVPKLLGVFNNYPEERTTQHPRAEIEDLRAWYLHRTPAGVAYSFDAHPVARAEELVRGTLCYRKSYCAHYSTDFDMALAVAKYLLKRGESNTFAQGAAEAAERIIAHLRAVDTIDLRLTPRQRQFVLTSALMKARRQELVDQERLRLSMRPQYEFFNDNRHEQHWWSWST